MTLFEYLSVLISIILSFGVIRLLDGLPSVFRPDRRYVLHLGWVVVVLGIHIQFWWAFWSYNDERVLWNYPRFLLTLASPLLLYSVAITLIPRESDQIASWRGHFDANRVRFFALLASWMAAVSLINWQLLRGPFLSRLRLGHAGFITLLLVGMVSPRPKVQKLVLVVAVVIWVVQIFGTFFEPGAAAR